MILSVSPKMVRHPSEIQSSANHSFSAWVERPCEKVVKGLLFPPWWRGCLFVCMGFFFYFAFLSSWTFKCQTLFAACLCPINIVHLPRVLFILCLPLTIQAARFRKRDGLSFLSESSLSHSPAAKPFGFIHISLCHCFISKKHPLFLKLFVALIKCPFSVIFSVCELEIYMTTWYPRHSCSLVH